RPSLAALRPQGWARGAALFAAAAGLWLVGRLSAVAVLAEAGAVAMLAASVPFVLGRQVARALAFPLAYMVFLVPVGDEFIPALQTITARITVALVRASQIPAHIDGVFIATPAGLFEIAQACSGAKFLVAMVALGVLAAHLCFAGWRRQVAFVAACAVVSVLANGLRAFATVLIAQWVGAKAAGGIDHVIYGWVFFALVMGGLLAVAWRWFDRPSGPPVLVVPKAGGRPWPVPLACAALMVLALLADLWAFAAEHLPAAMPDHIALPQVAGFAQVPYAPRHPWSPRARGADHRLLGSYADAAGRRVDVFVALYAAQGTGAKPGGFGEGAWNGDQGWEWEANAAAPPAVRAERLLAADGTLRLAETSYRSGGLLTGSVVALRLATLADRLALRPRAVAVLILSAEAAPGQEAAAHATMAALRRAMGPTGPWLDRVTGTQN
ncbi:MAG TPA: exosortase A, partial [Novosphingobium sp.]|nr:exosortase A [Novosphingobium sp.]